MNDERSEGEFCCGNALLAKDTSDWLKSAAQVFMLSSDALLDANTMKRVLSSGHSRVPVHRPGNR